VGDARGVPGEVEEPGDHVEGAQPGGGGRVPQATEQQHGEEERHHLQRVLVPSLLSRSGGRGIRSSQRLAAAAG